MKRSYFLFAAGLSFAAGIAAALLSQTAAAADAPPAPPSGNAACLQNIRIWGYTVVNQRTLTVTDQQNRKFVVRMTGGCVGLNNLINDIQIRARTNLGCLGQGDRVSFYEPTLGPMSCMIREVEPAPVAAAAPG